MESDYNQMKQEMNKTTEEKIRNLATEGKILQAQQLYFKQQQESRKGIIQL